MNGAGFPGSRNAPPWDPGRRSGESISRMQRTTRSALLVSVLVVAEQAAAQVTAPMEATGLTWLPEAEFQLLRRSFGRCLKVNYLKQGVSISEAEIARAWSNDLELYGSSLTVDDIRQAPLESIDRVPFIPCAWFSADFPAR